MLIGMNMMTIKRGMIMTIKMVLTITLIVIMMISET